MTGLGEGMALPKWYSNSIMFQCAPHTVAICTSCIRSQILENRGVLRFCNGVRLSKFNS